MDKIEFGQRVWFSQTYKRKWESRKIPNDEFGRSEAWKVWQTFSSIQTKEGIIIGKRTLSNGINHWDPDAGNMYESKDFFPAYLVAYDMKQKPVLVPIDNIIKMTNED